MKTNEEGANMTTIYFVRHCQPNFDNKDDRTRELTKKGLDDRESITAFLEDKNIDIIYSSPYKRCLDTIKPFAETLRLPINQIENLKERNIGKWVENFNDYAIKQWNDFNYKIENGESLLEVQNRNIKEISSILQKHSGKNIVISTHGTSFSTIVNYYNNNYNYDSFLKIKSIMPFIACLKFNNEEMISCKIMDPSTNKLVLSI